MAANAPKQLVRVLSLRQFCKSEANRLWQQPARGGFSTQPYTEKM